MAAQFDFTEMVRIREAIGNVKGRYGSVGSMSPAERELDDRMFGGPDEGREGSSAVRLGGSTKGFASAVSRQYRYAEQLLDSIERALDATEREKRDTEDTNHRSIRT
jgi:hypothetical protein